MIFNVKTLDGIMKVLDGRLAKLKISRSATKYFPGMNKTETVNNYHSRRATDISFKTLMHLLHGAGLELWVREIPKSSAQQKAFHVKFAGWMTEANLLLEPDSEVQEEQVPAPGQVLRRVSRGIVKIEDYVQDV